MSRIARTVAAVLMPRVFTAMTKVEAELVVEYATAGQSSFTLGLHPVVAGSVHLFKYPSLAAMTAGLDGSGSYGFEVYERAPVLGYNEVSTSDYSVTASTGAIAYSGAALAAGERVFASYSVDYDASGFSMSSLGDAVVLGSAALLGARLYSESNQKWDLVTQYTAQWDALMKALAEGGVVPDEIRRLKYWQEIERTSSQWGGVSFLRG